MKIILLSSILLFNLTSFGQSLFFNEYKVIDFKVPRSSDSYESRIIRINDQDTLIVKLDAPIGLCWNPVNENEIVGCNVWTCGKLNLVTNEFDTLYHPSNLEIMELSCNENSCYILTTSFEMERFDDYKLFKINVAANEIEELQLTRPFKILNLYSSNRYLSFIDYNYNEENDFVLASLIIYDIVNNDFVEIDQANSKNKEWFGGVDDRSIMCWNSDNELYYFKKETNKTKGTIFKYNIKTKLKTREFELPYERIQSFALKGDRIIIEHDNELLFIDKMGNEDSIYKVGYKFDYILNQFYVH